MRPALQLDHLVSQAIMYWYGDNASLHPKTARRVVSLPLKGVDPRSLVEFVADAYESRN